MRGWGAFTHHHARRYSRRGPPTPEHRRPRDQSPRHAHSHGRQIQRPLRHHEPAGSEGLKVRKQTPRGYKRRSKRGSEGGLRGVEGGTNPTGTSTFAARTNGAAVSARHMLLAAPRLKIDLRRGGGESPNNRPPAAGQSASKSVSPESTPRIRRE
eukprot:1184987-Prorocentrum_minimum.AAC.2